MHTKKNKSHISCCTKIFVKSFEIETSLSPKGIQEKFDALVEENTSPILHGWKSPLSNDYYGHKMYEGKRNEDGTFLIRKNLHIRRMFAPMCTGKIIKNHISFNFYCTLLSKILFFCRICLLGIAILANLSENRETSYRLLGLLVSSVIWSLTVCLYQIHTQRNFLTERFHAKKF